ncbi:AMP-dependent synthetase/ligase [Corynebacterium epidermidicanis]|uniref:Acyl-CoA synthetase n=1 Tax=Corynebacterium epidermidicanis TaxID=1050174 RepID=A0A0G3GSX8_9CORY|nr:long-chain fatty acid--CoA ligase [Corynebacterium epidermidicanis]AKK03640.1 AMP-forming long-chain acyl-CoA synthetase [Corynebacterium epidermidicanis]
MQEFATQANFELEPHETPLKALIATATARPYGVMFTRPRNFEWVNVTAKEFIAEVFEVAKGLIANGVREGDRVALLSETRYEWSLLDFAIWAAGAASVPIYGSSSQSQIQWIIEDSGAVFAITESREHTELMKHLELQDNGEPRLQGSPSQLRRILEINSSAVTTLKFEGRGITDEEVQQRIDATMGADLASLVYTSGTTGRPKGCMLTHANWLSEVRALLTHPIGAIAVPGTRVLTFLPMAHVLARAVSLAVAVGGATQSHWSDFSSLTVEFQRSRPNLILGVPRVFEKVRNGAAQKAADKSAVSGAMFLEAEKVAIEYSKSLDNGGPSRSLKLKHRAFDRLVFAKIRSAMGDEVRYCISGGSAMSHDLLHFFRGIGVPVYEGYGLTETSAAAAVDFQPQRIGTVGRPVGGMAARVNEEGEILLKGLQLFTGYWNNEEATREAIVDGWFNTGDLGEINDEGYLQISGRKKDLIVTAGGKNISPGPMEDLLRSHPLISQALVVGDGKPFVGVLLTLDEDAFRRWKLVHNFPEKTSVTELALNPQLRADIQDAINNTNATVSHTEAIKKFYILDRDLSEEADELTPTMKVKRNVVVRRFTKEINHIYKRN